MVLLWRGRWCTVDVLHPHVVPPFFCGFYHYFMVLVCLVKEQLVFFPRLEFRGFSSPLSDVVVEHPLLCQQGDTFGHHHGVGDFLAFCLREFSHLFQLLNQSVKGFRGVVGTHHLNCVLLKVDLVDHPVSG